MMMKCAIPDVQWSLIETRWTTWRSPFTKIQRQTLLSITGSQTDITKKNDSFLGFISYFEHPQSQQAIMQSCTRLRLSFKGVSFQKTWPLKMQSHQEYTPAAYCWCPALEMLSDCHAWKIQSSPDDGGFPVWSSIHKHRDRTGMFALPNKSRYVAITMKTSYFCRGYSRPASSWRRQSTGYSVQPTNRISSH